MIAYAGEWGIPCCVSGYEYCELPCDPQIIYPYTEEAPIPPLVFHNAPVLVYNIPPSLPPNGSLSRRDRFTVISLFLICD